jgi:hypothetical protein
MVPIFRQTVGDEVICLILRGQQMAVKAPPTCVVDCCG